MTHRTLVLLALLALATLSGCAHSEGRLGMTSVDDATLADEASLSVEGDESRYHLAERRLVQSAIDDDALANATDPPVNPDLPVAFGGRYYELSHERVGTTDGRSVEVAVDYNASDLSGDRIAYDELPRVDRLVVRPLLVDPIDDPKLLEPGTDRYRIATYADVDADRSVLVEDQEYDVVVYEGEAYPVEVRDRERVDLTTYRYGASVVAESPEAYGSMLRERYAFTLSNLSEEEESVLDGAADDAYYADSSADEGYDRLVDRFLEHTAVRKDAEHHSGLWIARYEGQLYWIEMDYNSFLSDSERRADTARDPIVAQPTPTASPTPDAEDTPTAEAEGSPSSEPTGSPISVTPIETGDGSPTPASGQ